MLRLMLQFIKRGSDDQDCELEAGFRRVAACERKTGRVAKSRYIACNYKVSAYIMSY